MILLWRWCGDFRALREELWEAGFMRFARHKKLPSLLRQETCATQQLLTMLFGLYRHRCAQGASRGAVDRRTVAITRLVR